ncbi:hypothetical protein CK102_15805 [Salmonella enterica subsp. enterica serovar Typhi]|nr:hypothetical protein [Salmonella enterica subsp. enterica serovar Typhi]
MNLVANVSPKGCVENYQLTEKGHSLLQQLTEAYIAGDEFARLLYVDRIILIKQLDTMKAYDLILRARIARF